MGTTFMDFFPTGEVAFGGGHKQKLISFIIICIFSSGVAAEGFDVVQVKPGDDVTLGCLAGEGHIKAVEWTRTDLEPEYVLFYSDRRSDPTQQHSTFRGRVQLVDGELKDRNVSLILKNVSSNDSGTYECRVSLGGSTRVKKALIETEPISSITLEVADSGPRNVEVGSHIRIGLAVGSVLLACLAGLAVVVVRKMKRTCGPQSSIL